MIRRHKGMICVWRRNLITSESSILTNAPNTNVLVWQRTETVLNPITNYAQTCQPKKFVLFQLAHCVEKRIQIKRNMSIQKCTPSFRMRGNTLKECQCIATPMFSTKLKRGGWSFQSNVTDSRGQSSVSVGTAVDKSRLFLEGGRRWFQTNARALEPGPENPLASWKAPTKPCP